MTDPTTTTDTIENDTTVPCSPPPPAPRLVRDPNTGLGGVASGIAHHYQLDVELVRIVFIIAALTSGFGVMAYLIAWAVIPMADYWPPTPVGFTAPIGTVTSAPAPAG